MSGPLATIYSQSNLLKKRLRDLLANPINYAQAAAYRLREDTQDPMFAANFLTGSPGAFAGVVKNKGGNWLAGSVEDALRGLKRPVQGMGVNPDTLIPNTNINSWIEGPLTKYAKTRMASPDDEVRKLAEQGVLHFEPAMIRERSPLMEKIVGRRETAGFPIQGVADSPLARSWENTTDSLVRNLEAHDLSSAERASSFGGKSNIPGDTIVHQINPFASGAGISDIGFPHLIDELSNALNPNSGLPPHLQLTPEAVKQMSMEKAVRRVADINAFRAAQQVEANRKLAEQASLVREYAENNPKGLRWVELKANPKIDELGNVVNKGDRDLADQLKYEGDTMGHCVGGYCDDVLSGRSRIFSLRDAKGEPHVTVEVSPDPEALTDAYRWDKPSIVQIKGKANRKPNEEYLPFVQDFVRNSPLGGQWSDVGDLGNAGLPHRLSDFSPEVRAAMGQYDIKAPGEYLSTEEVNSILNAINKAKGFASGGSVRSRADLDNLIASLQGT